MKIVQIMETMPFKKIYIVQSGHENVINLKVTGFISKYKQSTTPQTQNHPPKQNTETVQDPSQQTRKD